jgi:hypothetical protein
MSQFFDQASLVMVPSGYKDGKVYSQKPLSTDGELTFSRSTSATRVGPDGLIEKVRTNQVLQSNSFDTTWVNSNTTETGGQTGYDSTSNAWLLSKSAAGGDINQTGLSVSGLQTFSLYAKAGTSTWISMTILGGSNPRTSFDLVNGVVGTLLGSAVSAKIESVGNGFYRCSIVGNVTSTGVYIYPSEGDGVTSGTTGNILIQSAQLETGDIATQPILTTTAAVSVGPVANLPRLDYSGGATCPKLLLEPQRTNVLLSSENWTTNWGGANRLVTANDIISPDGYQNADKLAAAGGGAYYSQVRTTASGANTFSVFLKYGNKPVQALYAYSSGIYFAQAYFNIQTGVVSSVASGTATMEDYGNGWYRCSISGTAATSTIEIGLDGIGLTDYSYAWGAQLEAGAYATSYIPTLGAAVTRGADAASKTGIDSLIDDNKGTLYMEVTPTNFVGDQRFGVSDSGGTNRIVLRLFNPSNLQLSAVINSSVEISISNSGYTAGNTYKIAGAWEQNNAVIYINGVQVAIDTNCNTSASAPLNRIGFDNGVGTAKFENPVKQILYFPTRLSNADLAALTA